MVVSPHTTRMRKPLGASGTACPWEGTAMNKMVKASVVGAAGVSLLMGGFGTYALWHDSAGTGAGTSITSGVLDVNANTATWQDVSATGPNSWTPGNPIVPGDKLKMTQTFDVTATGANMK